MKILVAADGSPYTNKVISYLAAHHEWLGATHHYTVLTCIPYVPPRVAAFLSRDTITTYYAEEAEKVFEPIRAFMAAQGLTADFVPTVGHAAQQIAERADGEAFDLVVMGSHGHQAFGNLVLGSVATKVLASCKTAVLIVR